MTPDDTEGDRELTPDEVAEFTRRSLSRASDHVSPTVGIFVEALNEWLPDAHDRFEPYLAGLAGSKGFSAQEQTRAYMLANWAIHVAAPLSLRAAGLPNEAPILERVLAQVRTRIGRYRELGIGEQDTKAAFIDPVLRALGWDVEDLEEVQREYRLKSGDNPVDYAL